MGFHTYDVGRADALEDRDRFRYVSVEELLGLLDVAPDATVADLGSGTGFYTDPVADAVGQVVALDIQPAMHRYYLAKGVPGNVHLVTAAATDLPVRDDALDGVFSTMTYHEFASDAALAELARIVRPGGHVAIADWSAAGPGTDGPPLSERFTVEDAERALGDAGFAVEDATHRRETFVLKARR